MNKLLMEFIGTFFLTALAMHSGGAGMTMAIVLMTLVYTGAWISYSHFNPVVTMGVLMRGKMDAGTAGGYIGAQVAGAVVAALFMKWQFGAAGVVSALPETASYLKLFTLTTVFTFLLAYVVLQTSTLKPTAGNSFFGLAIGGALFMGITMGVAMNPAVMLGQELVGHFSVEGATFAWGALATYIGGGLVGGVVAGLLFPVLNESN